MGDRHNLGTVFSVLSPQEFSIFYDKYNISPKLNPVLPAPGQTAVVPDGMITLYTKKFDFANCRYPVTSFLLELLLYHNVRFDQLNPLGLCKVSHFEVACRAYGGWPSGNLFRVFYHLGTAGDWFTFVKRKKPSPFMALKIPNSLKNWKDHYLYVSSTFLPVTLPYRDINASIDDPPPDKGTYEEGLYTLLTSGPSLIDVYDEPTLVMAGISHNWDTPLLRPVLVRNGVEVDLLDLVMGGDLGVTRKAVNVVPTVDRVGSPVAASSAQSASASHGIIISPWSRRMIMRRWRLLVGAREKTGSLQMAHLRSGLPYG
ncbi:hypothetical protein L1987_60423 [Smallanthus sonchifolius]|uniref:Uncharacterized protein n=1 Tax=Smallanthus sonchifolius TaxID=185202 RepID=A0ACB9D7Z9_9ASTR|nr:hypothetical protein L1987_60423 [Smallanthus sonchifolius]